MIIITGQPAHIIGRETAPLFLEQQANLILVDQRISHLESLTKIKTKRTAIYYDRSRCFKEKDVKD